MSERCEGTNQQNLYDKRGVSVFYHQLQTNPKYEGCVIPQLITAPNLNGLKVARDRYAYGFALDQPCLYQGLDRLIRTTVGERQVPLYVVDNHNHALFAWCEALDQEKIRPGAALVHLDSHLDMSTPANLEPVDAHDLSAVHDYVCTLDVGAFIHPAMETMGLVGKMIFIHPGNTADLFYDEKTMGYKRSLVHAGMDNPQLWALIDKISDPRDLIVDIDLDYFVDLFKEKRKKERLKERSFENAEDLLRHDIDLMKALIKRAGVVTMATSPGFINQEQAIELAREIAEFI